MSGHLWIVSAPSGAGKTSLTRALVPYLAQRGVDATISISYTTRPPRPGEQNGVHYHFVDEPAFQRMVTRGEFLEHAEVFGRRYGTGREATDKLLAEGREVLLDIDWQGGRQVRSQRRAAAVCRGAGAQAAIARPGHRCRDHRPHAEGAGGDVALE
jgi:guanylate kinase